jgi:hypothetical protein
MEITPDLKKDMMAATIEHIQRLVHEKETDWTEEMRMAGMAYFILGIEAAFSVAADYLDQSGLTSLPKELITDLADQYYALRMKMYEENKNDA